MAGLCEGSNEPSCSLKAIFEVPWMRASTVLQDCSAPGGSLPNPTTPSAPDSHTTIKLMVLHEDSARHHLATLNNPKFAACHPIPSWRIKTHLTWKKFSSNEEGIATAAAEGIFAYLEESVDKEGIAALKHRWTNCVNVTGDYVEK
ncbi:hypothetical protein ANN_23834 [Periplaneta americana]|uniref:Uncharacterized protein n=1 Tax=Periplaneta americana TaxID=6978 RepID=A0ABQ8SNA1_PERAM|nr:hypothetical protein ANN_23834 [Periplaneta americana]